MCTLSPVDMVNASFVTTPDENGVYGRHGAQDMPAVVRPGPRPSSLTRSGPRFRSSEEMATWIDDESQSRRHDRCSDSTFQPRPEDLELVKRVASMQARALTSQLRSSSISVRHVSPSWKPSRAARRSSSISGPMDGFQ